MIDLAKGYFIDEKPNGCILKKRYPGIRNGVPAECEKIISHHKDTEDAKEAFFKPYEGIFKRQRVNFLAGAP